jgi:hypothetical protein
MIDCVTFYDCDYDCLAIYGMIPWRKMADFTAWLGLAMTFSRSFMNSRSYVHMNGRKEGTDGHNDRRFYLHFDVLVPLLPQQKRKIK